MQRSTTMPSWVLPGILCVVSIAALAVLKFHFDHNFTSAFASPGASSNAERDVSGDGGGSRLGSSAAEPDFSGYEVVSSGSDVDSAEPRTAVGGAVAEADDAGSPPDIGDDVFVPDGTVWVDRDSSGRAWSDLGAVEGLLTFRGNPTRTFYGQGPLPTAPRVQWEYLVGCSVSPVGGEAKEWCGSGWTGQPAVFQLPTTGEWTVAFGAYNRRVNFLDPATGAEALPPYQTNDIIKGSVTVDPDGYPLLYTGSRDDQSHVVAIDGAAPRPLWQLSSDSDGPTLW
ncbi:MAG: hypothetical protein ACR2QO_28420, partial [Acidimicrobiales bacterium]